MEGEGKTIQEIGPFVAGAKGRVVYETGDMEHGIWSAGTCMGLINDIPTCKELIERIVGEAEAMIRGRLAKAIAAQAAASPKAVTDATLRDSRKAWLAAWA